MENQHIDGSVLLNNYLQAKNRLNALNYEAYMEGPRNAPTWTVRAKIDGVVRGSACGKQRHIARDLAARQALNFLITVWGP
ncbi:hypothetical protein FISHEDRAFT_73347 [Fistulina hepatica ATCC 64428]|uniref:DRBM domain-containing protein n=1 Tax=Fistulina hepatica ATCC 64428 TaxID=1128425 RepID=A0A0D7AFT3_9AGAR|nr:hypothetical protein FISHEDRAFT_73347 [Fistulina hepatica ATCC 64428]